MVFVVLQKYTDFVMQYFCDCKFKINSSKTEAISIFLVTILTGYTNKRERSERSLASKVKYLGQILDKQLHFDKQIEQILHKNFKLI
jgi:hypothetical protein